MNKKAYRDVKVVGLRSNPKLYNCRWLYGKIIEVNCGLGCRCQGTSNTDGRSKEQAYQQALLDMTNRHNKKQVEFSKRIREGDLRVTSNRLQLPEPRFRLRRSESIYYAPITTRQDPLSGREVPEVRLDPTA